MESRKVQITGGSTYIISLPKRWVEKVGIKNGDNIVLFPQADGTLLINPKVNKEPEKTTKMIHIEYEETDEMTRKFIAAYLAGYNIIEFKAKNMLTADIRQKIRELSHYVIGPEIIDETMSTMTLQDLIDASDFSLKKGLRRMHVITREMHNDANLALKEQDVQLAQDVESRDDEVDKLYWMIAKQYNQILKDVFFAEKMGTTPVDALSYLLIARAMERIADHAKKLAENIKNIHSKSNLILKISEASTKIIGILDAAMNAFYGNRFDDANDVVNKAKKFVKTINALRHELMTLQGDTPETISLAYIIDSLERTRSYALDIAEIAINHQLATEV